jgi:hypothetical protein
MKGTDWFIVFLVIGVVYWLVTESSKEDTRPEAVKWVEDSRNACKLREELQLANQLVHIKQDQYRPKVLSLYDCKGGLTAALIREVKDDVKGR